MRKIVHFPAFAAIAPVMLALTACGTAEQQEEVAGGEPVTEEGITDLDGDPEMFDAEVGRPAFQEAMRTACPTTGIGRAECKNSDVEGEYLCEYELIDGEGEVFTATLQREGESWSLAETPDHCEPA